MQRIVLDPNAVRPQLPPYEEVDHPAIREAAAAWDVATASLKALRRDVTDLEQTREGAEWRDAEAAEEARAAGKPEPKRSHVAEHDKKLDAARHELKIATLAENRAFGQLQNALDAHQADWLGATTQEVETLAKAWNAAVATLDDLHGKLARAHRSRAFASNGDTQNDGPGVLTSAIRVSPREVQGLDFAPPPEGAKPAPGSQARAPKGTIAFGHVISELTAMGTLPEPEPQLEAREMQTVNILGATRTIPKPIDADKREERLERADSRRAARQATVEADRAAAEAV